VSPSLSGGDERSEPESAIPALSNGGETSGTGTGPEPASGAAAAGSAIPCLNKTTACKDEPPLLPGPRKKQARALVENIEWMAKTFGQGRVGFLTLTIGDMDAGGRFRNLRDRKEAQRRFHSLLTNELCSISSAALSSPNVMPTGVFTSTWPWYAGKTFGGILILMPAFRLKIVLGSRHANRITQPQMRL